MSIITETNVNTLGVMEKNQHSKMCAMDLVFAMHTTSVTAFTALKDKNVLVVPALGYLQVIPQFVLVMATVLLQIFASAKTNLKDITVPLLMRIIAVLVQFVTAFGSFFLLACLS